ncbi:hypothetical protein [Marinomonas spartinae]|uniref:hypothetical protein n=1 Tax=Marinomonas spartinae TaxID=1792290 RepID=UPI0018F19259|nr:hypothetical protein [Marinomonas spartinae]MBJ7556613.1 hypothetical protein [Marinomonas spartinae]
MYEQVEKPKENKSRAVTNTVTQKKNAGRQGFWFVDNRPEAAAQRAQQVITNNRRQSKQTVQLQVLTPPFQTIQLEKYKFENPAPDEMMSNAAYEKNWTEQMVLAEISDRDVAGAVLKHTPDRATAVKHIRILKEFQTSQNRSNQMVYNSFKASARDDHYSSTAKYNQDMAELIAAQEEVGRLAIWSSNGVYVNARAGTQYNIGLARTYSIEPLTEVDLLYAKEDTPHVDEVKSTAGAFVDKIGSNQFPNLLTWAERNNGVARVVVHDNLASLIAKFRIDRYHDRFNTLETLVYDNNLEVVFRDGDAIEVIEDIRALIDRIKKEKEEADLDSIIEEMHEGEGFH